MTNELVAKKKGCILLSNVRKNLILSAIGVGLQTAGGICLFVAALGIGKEINRQIRKTIIKELSKQAAED